MKKRGEMKKEKRGLSPVIATVLLISIVIILFVIIFLWARGFIKEAVEKEGKSAEQACTEVDLAISLSVDNSEISMVNNGNIPIYQIELLVKKAYTQNRETISAELTTGQSASKPIKTSIGENDEVSAVPIIVGMVKNQKTTYTCNNNPITVK